MELLSPLNGTNMVMPHEAFYLRTDNLLGATIPFPKTNRKVCSWVLQ